MTTPNTAVFENLVDRIRVGHLAVVLSSVAIMLTLMIKPEYYDEVIDELDVIELIKNSDVSLSKAAADIVVEEFKQKDVNSIEQAAIFYSQIKTLMEVSGNGRPIGKDNKRIALSSQLPSADHDIFSPFIDDEQGVFIVTLNPTNVFTDNNNGYTDDLKPYELHIKDIVSILRSLRGKNEFVLLTGFDPHITNLTPDSKGRLDFEECLFGHDYKTIDFNGLLQEVNLTNRGEKKVDIVFGESVPSKCFMDTNSLIPELELIFFHTSDEFWTRNSSETKYVSIEEIRTHLFVLPKLMTLILPNASTAEKTIVLNGFPALINLKDQFKNIDIASMKSSDIRAFVETLKVYQSDNVELFGIKISNSLIFPWAAVFLSVLLLHFCLHLKQAKKIGRVNEPWFGFYNDWTAVAMLWGSMLLLPSIAFVYSFMEAPMETNTDYVKLGLTGLLTLFSQYQVIVSLSMKPLTKTIKAHESDDVPNRNY